MTATREDIKGAANDLGWSRVDGLTRNTDVYRNAPHSIMVDFSRDGMIINASLFIDAPDARTTLPPKVVKTVTKHDANKYRRIRSWLYDHQTRIA